MLSDFSRVVSKDLTHNISPPQLIEEGMVILVSCWLFIVSSFKIFFRESAPKGIRSFQHIVKFIVFYYYLSINPSKPAGVWYYYYLNIYSSFIIILFLFILLLISFILSNPSSVKWALDFINSAICTKSK